MEVVELWRYPVKSLGGERLTVAEVGELGLSGDRRWGIRDDETGNVLTARREPRLLFASARLVDGSPVITTSDGDDVSDSARLSAWLGRPVTLTEAGDAGGSIVAQGTPEKIATSKRSRTAPFLEAALAGQLSGTSPKPARKRRAPKT